MLPRASLEEACDDPDMIGLPLWPVQRKVVRALDAGARIVVQALGRRSGKTELTAAIGLHNATLRYDLTAMVRPGQTRYVVAVATSQAQARLTIAAALAMVERSPLLSDLLDRPTDDALWFRLPDGSQTCFAAFPCNSRGGRGWAVSCLLMDEAAHFFSDTEGPQAADRVWAALSPSTAQFGSSGQIVLSSTPWGTDGLFAKLFEDAKAGALPGGVAFHASTKEANPTIDRAFLDAEFQRDPEMFAVEYEAHFASSGDAYLDMSRLVVVDGQGDLPPKEGRGWVAGLDPAFARDPFGIALVGRDATAQGQLVVGLVRSMKPTGKFAAVLDSVGDVLKPYGPKVVTDQHAAVPVREHLTKAGFAVRVEHTSGPSKSAMYADMRAALYNGRLTLPDHKGLLRELASLRTRYTAGAASVVNPRRGGSHGDIVSALALAVSDQLRRGGVVGLGPDIWELAASRPEPSMYAKAWSEHADTPEHRRWSQRNWCSDCNEDLVSRGLADPAGVA